MLPTLTFIGNISAVQWVVIGVVGLLVFGKRLPQVGKSLGQGIVEFKKGLQGMNDEIESASKNASRQIDEKGSSKSAGPAVSEKRETESSQA